MIWSKTGQVKRDTPQKIKKFQKQIQCLVELFILSIQQSTPCTYSVYQHAGIKQVNIHT